MFITLWLWAWFGSSHDSLAIGTVFVSSQPLLNALYMKQMPTLEVFQFFVVCKIYVANGACVSFCSIGFILLVGNQIDLFFTHCCPAASAFLSCYSPNLIMKNNQMKEHFFIELSTAYPYLSDIVNESHHNNVILIIRPAQRREFILTFIFIFVTIFKKLIDESRKVSFAWWDMF